MAKYILVATKSYRKDLKKIKNDPKIKKELIYVLNKLINDEVLEPKYKVNALNGEYKGCFDCHVRPDLVLVYSYEDNKLIVAIRLASHSKLEF